MKNRRLVGFVLSILLGLIAGLAYGWLIKPAGVKTTTLNSMRADYKADFVLMIAESYSVDQDLETALNLLKRVEPTQPQQAVQEALLTAEELAFSQFEIDALTRLNNAINVLAEAVP